MGSFTPLATLASTSPRAVASVSAAESRECTFFFVFAATVMALTHLLTSVRVSVSTGMAPRVGVMWRAAIRRYFSRVPAETPVGPSMCSATTVATDGAVERILEAAWAASAKDWPLALRKSVRDCASARVARVQEVCLPVSASRHRTAQEVVPSLRVRSRMLAMP